MEQLRLETCGQFDWNEFIRLEPLYRLRSHRTRSLKRNSQFTLPDANTTQLDGRVVSCRRRAVWIGHNTRQHMVRHGTLHGTARRSATLRNDAVTKTRFNAMEAITQGGIMRRKRRSVQQTWERDRFLRRMPQQGAACERSQPINRALLRPYRAVPYATSPRRIRCELEITGNGFLRCHSLPIPCKQLDARMNSPAEKWLFLHSRSTVATLCGWGGQTYNLLMSSSFRIHCAKNG